MDDRDVRPADVATAAALGVPTAGAGWRVAGWGAALGDVRRTNDDLAETLDTSDAWIRERTGIAARHIGASTTVMAIEAGRRALTHGGVAPSSIDMVVLATTTPDQTMPASATVVHEALGLGGGSFDLNAACAGFVYALVTAQGLLAMGSKRLLLIGADQMSRITDWNDRNTAVLFGDGAGALVLEASPPATSAGSPTPTDPVTAPGVVAWHAGTDGSTRHLLCADHGSTTRMDGREVFRRAVRVVVESAEIALDRAGVGPDDVDRFVPHQANARIIEAAADRIGIPPDRCETVLAETGNTSAASIPIALAGAADERRLSDGDLVLISGFGAGMTWASALVRWGTTSDEEGSRR